jgi:carboxyl-terminal processing protease
MARPSAARVSFLGGVALLAVAFAWLRTEHPSPHATARSAAPSPPRSAPSAAPTPASDADETSCQDDALVQPTGRPTGLTCAEARSLMQEIQQRFAADLPEPLPNAFAESMTSWLDPHGLWSASADAPTGPLIANEAERMLAELRDSPASAAPCKAATEIGAALARWVAELQTAFDTASAGAPALSRENAAELALASAFEDGDVTVPARSLAAELGRRVGSIAAAYGSTLEPFARTSRERFLPTLEAAEWQRIVLAAAVRSYVSVVDPHGAWAPLDEEWSLYADDPSFDDDERLWGDMLRTALGVRVVDAPTPPLEMDDLVLSIQGVPTVGLSIEQVEQLARADSPVSPSLGRSVVVLRAGEDSPRELVVEPDAGGDDDDTEVAADENVPSKRSDAGAEVAIDFVPYGHGNAEVLTIRYVGDDLGERVAGAVADALSARTRPVGILLDLRGNGGGSTDGAAAALGVFEPGVPAFPLLHRGQVTEVLSAQAPAPSSRWRGPVATLVDGATASAAEMLAGGLAKYRRGPLLGQRTYGKGCVQEYFRDRVGAGVLRLTTRLYTLPDGSPVQRRGLTPDLFVGPDEPGEREADTPDSLEPMNGPDVRVPFMPGPSWPSSVGRVGPCPDSVICTALRKAAGTPMARVRPEPAARKRRAPRPHSPASR